MKSASPHPQHSTQASQEITNKSLRGQRHASKRPIKPKPLNIMECICRSFGPALRALLKDGLPITCNRDPLGGPGWLLQFPYYNMCEVVVCSDPSLQLQVIGYWVDRDNWDMVRLPPLIIPLDENSKRNHAFEFQILVLYTYGCLLAMSEHSGGFLRGPESRTLYRSELQGASEG